MAKKSKPKGEGVNVAAKAEIPLAESLALDKIIQRASAVVRFLHHQSLDHFAETVESLISAVEQGKSK